MLAAGLVKLGTAPRFASNAVMVGFVAAVGVTSILGQSVNLTGRQAEGVNRVVRAFNTVIHPGRLRYQTLGAGLATIALILLLERTKLGPLDLVVAVIITSAGVAVLGWSQVAILDDLGAILCSLPLPSAPTMRLVPVLIVPAVALAFVGLVQGAAVSANDTNPDGSNPDASRDFVGQGAANVVAGAFQGMPVRVPVGIVAR